MTVYRGVPYDVLGAGRSTARSTSSGVSARAAHARASATTVTAHELRSRDDADDLVRQLELGRVGTQ